MNVHAHSPFAYILAQATVSFEQFVLKKYSCWFGLTKGKNIVTNICKNICSFSAFFHWHFPPGSVTAQPSKSVCHWASGERKQTLCSVDQKTPIDFDASLAVCLILSLESQPHLTLLATRAKQSQTPPRSWGTSAAFGFPSPGLFCWHRSTKGWDCLWRPGPWGVLQAGAAPVQCPRLQGWLSIISHSAQSSTERAAELKLTVAAGILLCEMCWRQDFQLNHRGGSDGALSSLGAEVWAVQHLMTARVQTGWRCLTSNIFTVSEEYRLSASRAAAAPPADHSWNPQ